MQTPSSRWLWSLPIAALLLAWQMPARAGLGGNVDSVTVDSTALRGQLRSIPQTLYDAHAITTASGTVVREYATRGGQVFAVTWQGPLLPNLQQLLGEHFESFRSAIAAERQIHHGIQRQVQVQQSDLVVLSTGRLRAFRGRAYIPSLVPEGVSVAQLP